MERAVTVNADAVSAPPVPGEQAVFPVSFAQARLWFLDQLEPGSPLYNMPAAFRIRGPQDVDVLRRALDEIVRRHEALRTTFRTVDGKPVQVIAPSLSVAVPIVDLSGLPEPEREATAARLASEEGRTPFDLSRGPLLRVKILRLAEDDRILLLTFHHIVSDGWSLGVFYRELSILYEAFSAGRPSPLPELAIQYADFAVWQREKLEGPALAALIAYWRAHLDGAPAIVDLPTDRPRPPVQSFRGTTHSFRLPPAQQEAVQALGRKLSATPFMILLAAYAVLVSRHARQTDLVIGAPIANRTRAELEDLIGFFVNMLALRIDTSGAPSFRDLVLRVREVTLGAYAHQDLPFERLVDELAPERSLSHSPLVQVTFGLHNTPIDAAGGPAEPALGPPPVSAETAKFDLTLIMMESEHGLLATFEYDTALFDAATIERMAGELTVLLAAATADPDRRITDLPLLTAEERADLLTRWNDTAVPFPEDACLHDLFTEQVARTPEAEALVCGSQTLTYRALAARSNRLAHLLRSLGVGPEVRVGICLSRSPLMVVAMLGVLAAGGAYVPLDPEYPRERLAFMIEDAAPRVILTESALATTLPRAEGSPLVCLDNVVARLADLPEVPPASGATAGNLAYMIYTSGSTGRPKGVLVEHRGLANLPTVQARVYGIGAGDRVLQMASPSFDTAVCEIFCALTAGATLVMAASDEHLPGPGLVRLIREQRVTAMIVPPSVLAAVPADESPSLPIRLLAMVGEACPAELVKRWAAPGRRVVNSYGPTEATIWASSAVDIDGSRPPPIGFPVANVRIYLVDPAGEPVPLGVAGEVLVGGVGVTRGYHRRPDLTAERFIPDPFSRDPGARVYRTGDLARRLPDGNLEFVGRVDDQVKLRGYRIEVAEIEAVLGEHPAIEAAAVVCRDVPPGRRELVAYLVEDPRPGKPRDPSAEIGGGLQHEWRAIFEETYRASRPAPANDLDTVGWKSSFTGAPFSAEEMAEWADASAARILALGPRRVLDVGCGTGLVLHRVAPRVERYVGIDFSAAAIDQLSAEVRARGLEQGGMGGREVGAFPESAEGTLRGPHRSPPIFKGVHLERRDAADLAGLGERGFDVVVLSSIVQYFPSLDFLLQVLSSAMALLTDEGAVFLGDVRSLPHLAVQHASMALHRAAEGFSRADLRATAERRRELEQELCVHPELFHALRDRIPGIASVDVELRRGRHRNEMSKFRYDVVIRKGVAPDARIAAARVDASRYPDLRRILTEDAPPAVLVEGLENQRVADDVRVLDWLERARDGTTAEELRAAIAAEPAPGVDPEDLIALAESVGYTASVSFSGDDPIRRFDALLVRRGVAGRCEGFPRRATAIPEPLANDPLAGRRERALVQSVRAHLEQHLPSYMIPASFVRIDALPLSPNGKVDRKALLALGAHALPAPGLSGSDEAYRGPRNAVEEALAKIWASVLRLSRVGIHDNFFEIGGDSILSIQIVSRAQQEGISLTPRLMFQHQTIAGLAAVAGASPAVMADQGAITGSAPLTPVQRWWLEKNIAEPHHWNQSMLLDAREAIDPAALSQAIARLVEHHDALRLRIAQSADGARMVFAEPGGAAPFSRVDLGAIPEAERGRAMAEAMATAEASLDLVEGPIMRAVLFDLGASAPARLLLVIHHLAVDAVSWSILLDDLGAAYEAARRGAPARLPAKTTSFKRWAERLAEHAASEAARSELHLWLDPSRRATAPIPIDHDTGPDDCGSARHITVSLSPEETERLLRGAPAAYRARIDDLLVTAFAAALSRWTGSSTVQIDLEGHGREETVSGVDLTRTVGWFTNIVPIALRIGDLAPPDAVASVQKRLAEISGHRLGYGLLRHLRADTKDELRALPPPEVCFNYLGQIDRAIPEGAALVPAGEPAGPDRSPAGRRTHLLEVNACVAAGRFHATFGYSEHRHRGATIERVAEAFVEALRQILTRAEPAPTDARVEDRYPLSPLQEGILFHARATASEPVYLVETCWTMEGDLDHAAFTAALQDLVDRHPALRTSFAWEGLDAPVQIVHTGVALPIEERDLRALAPDEQAREVRRHADAERARGFDLRVAPLMRVALLRLRDDAVRFVWILHHLILDGWSTPILIEELFALYEARRAGRALPLAPPPPFRAYIDWLKTQDRSGDRAFWRRELEGFTAPTPLGADHAPRDVEGSRAGWHRISIEGDAATAIAGFAQRTKITLSTLVEGAWALLLSRYSGEDDVVFGATVSGRSAKVPGILRMVGLLINTLPVRVRAPNDARAEAWLAELQVHLAELREHEHSPLVEVMKESEVPRGAPLFESVVVFENYPIPDVQLAAEPPDGARALRITDARNFDDVPLPLTLLAAHRGGIHLELGYDRRRFDDAAAQRIAQHLATLLAAFAKHPEARLRDLSLLPDDERRRLLSLGNDTAADYPRSVCLHHLFEGRAAATPDAPALLFEGRTVRYRELADRARAIADRLRALGVTRGARVGICAERSPEAVAGILGVLMAGAAWVPLDPGQPRDRLAFMIEDARLAVILTDARSAAKLSDPRVELLDAVAAAANPTTPVDSGVTAAEPAYVIYTSGSTGRPKGVIGTHRGMVNRCFWMWRRYPFAEGEVSCHKTSLGFTDSIWEIFGPLLQGVPSLILPDARVHDLGLFQQALADARVTRVVLVPSLLRALLDVTPDLGRRLPDLDIVTTSGEALPADLASRFHRAMPGRLLLNIYGSTEVSADATFVEVPEGPAESVTIGVPIANTRATILDRAMHPAPIGVPGELFIGGDGVALGYLDRPELTAERFLPDPSSPDPGARVFRTGDRARRLASGEIQLLGRLDDQVKIRGVRIELGEVRAALLEHPRVADAAVVARPDERKEAQLVAYVVARGDEPPQATTLAAHLRERLPAAMVPSAFVTLRALPLLHNGKLDRRALPAPEKPMAQLDYVAPRNPVEEQIAAIWAEVLGIERVSVTAGFFDLGGHSLLLARVHDRLSARFDRKITIVDLLAHPTVTSLARLLGAPADEGQGEDDAAERARKRRRAAARRAKGGDHG